MKPVGLSVFLVASLLGPVPRALAQDTAPKPAPNPTDDLRAQLEELRKKIDALEPHGAAQTKSGLDLSEKEVAPGTLQSDSSPLARRWTDNVELWGFGAFSYLDTGDAGTRPNGGFLLQEAALFLEAQAWERTKLHVELQVAPLGVGENEQIGVGEVYGEFQDLWSNTSGDRLSLRAGRFYIPFGEEYTSARATDNPLISNSAPFLYGYDQGLELLGNYGKLGWIASLTDGVDEHAPGKHFGKAANLKLYGEPWTGIYLSASAMLNGSTDSSAVEFGGSYLQPVGADNASTAGVSPSATIRARLYELDARWQLRSDTSLALAFGQARILDDASAFDRDITWFRFEPRHDFSPSVYAVLRASEIGTYDGQQGYHFDGAIIAGGEQAFGYDTRRFQRLSAGVGWKINPHAVLKFEAGRDQFWVIDGSPFAQGSDDRTFFGTQLVVSF